MNVRGDRERERDKLISMQECYGQKSLNISLYGSSWSFVVGCESPLLSSKSGYFSKLLVSPGCRYLGMIGAWKVLNKAISKPYD